MNMHKSKRSLRALIAVAGLVTALGTAAATGQIIKQVPKKQLVVVYPKLEVKQFSGDFTQWGVIGSIEKGGDLNKEFRWNTSRADVAAARYEVSTSTFPAPTNYSAAFTLAKGSVPVQAIGPNTLNYFTINFNPLIQSIFGNNQPSPITFHIRLVLLDAQNGPLSPVSQTVKVEYTLPAPGTKLDQSMKLRLKTVKCVYQTDGPGQDDIVVRIIGAATTNQGTAKLLFSHWEANIDDDWEINPNKLLWEYTGLGFNSNVYILAAVAEEDVAPLLAGFYSATSSVPNSGHQTGNLIAEFSKELCELKDHDCLGPPQIIPVTQADWNKVALGGQTIEKKIYFHGLGGSYRLSFELSPK